jgi:Protein-L-isoaspartate(D-aspartate) O-methyltransferase (PCMT)
MQFRTTGLLLLGAMALPAPGTAQTTPAPPAITRTVVAATKLPTVTDVRARLKIGGRLVIPVGADQRAGELVRVTRVSANKYRSEGIAGVCFVPFDRGGGVSDREGR